MRYVIFILLFCIGSFAFSQKEMYSKIEILKKREKFDFRDIKVPYDPFFKYKIINNISKRAIAPKKFGFVLLTILNHKAFINNRWYKQGENIHGYRVVKIYKERVILQKRDKKVILNIKQKRKYLNITERHK